MKNKQLRNQIVDLLSELKAVGANKYARRRSVAERTHRVGAVSYSSYANIHEQVVEWSEGSNIPLDKIEVAFDFETDFEGWEDPILVLTAYMPETDAEYHSRLLELNSDMIKNMSITDAEWGQLFVSINSDLYVARNITMSEHKVIEYLDDLSRIHNALYDYHNGEATEYDMVLQQRSVYKEMKAKYL